MGLDLNELVSLLEDVEKKVGYEVPELDAAISMVYEEIEAQD